MQCYTGFRGFITAARCIAESLVQSIYSEASVVEEVPKMVIAGYQKDRSVEGSFFLCCLSQSQPSGPQH